LAEIERKPVHRADDKQIWALALEGKDDLAVAALDRFCLSLGAVAGDLALAHGPTGVVIAGGPGVALEGSSAAIGLRPAVRRQGPVPGSDVSIPVKLITHPQPGLYGAAAAFAQEHAR
jgi:glucokinase